MRLAEQCLGVCGAGCTHLGFCPGPVSFKLAGQPWPSCLPFLILLIIWEMRKQGEPLGAPCRQSLVLWCDMQPDPLKGDTHRGTVYREARLHVLTTIAGTLLGCLSSCCSPKIFPIPTAVTVLALSFLSYHLYNHYLQYCKICF